jgi:hypothetical protein
MIGLLVDRFRRCRDGPLVANERPVGFSSNVESVFTEAGGSC